MRLMDVEKKKNEFFMSQLSDIRDAVDNYLTSRGFQNNPRTQPGLSFSEVSALFCLEKRPVLIGIGDPLTRNMEVMIDCLWRFFKNLNKPYMLSDELSEHGKINSRVTYDTPRLDTSIFFRFKPKEERDDRGMNELCYLFSKSDRTLMLTKDHVICRWEGMTNITDSIIKGDMNYKTECCDKNCDECFFNKYAFNAVYKEDGRTEKEPLCQFTDKITEEGGLELASLKGPCEHYEEGHMLYLWKMKGEFKNFPISQQYLIDINHPRSAQGTCGLEFDESYPFCIGRDEIWENGRCYNNTETCSRCDRYHFTSDSTIEHWKKKGRPSEDDEHRFNF